MFGRFYPILPVPRRTGKRDCESSEPADGAWAGWKRGLFIYRTGILNLDSLLIDGETVSFRFYRKWFGQEGQAFALEHYSAEIVEKRRPDLQSS